MVPAYSVRVSRVPTYSGYCHARSSFMYGAFTLSGRLSQNLSIRLTRQSCSPNPGVHALRFGLFRVRSPLLTESHVVFSSSGYLDVSVRRVPLLQAMYSPADDSSCLLPGSPIRTPPLLRFLTASRSFSQFGASFFSFEWQGIRRTPFLT